MTVQELEEKMKKHGLVIRAIPDSIPRDISGTFIITSEKGTGHIVNTWHRVKGKTAFYSSIEEAIQGYERSLYYPKR